MDKIVLLTGVTGYLGSHLAIKLVKMGVQVIGLKRPSSGLARLKPILNDIILYDIDGSDLHNIFNNHDIKYIIHTATCYGRNNENASEIFETNLIFPMKLLELAIHFNTDTFFNTDTIGYKYLSDYSLSKKQFLEWGSRFVADKKTMFVNVRLEHMYGPNDSDSKFVSYILKECLSNKSFIELTKGEQKRDFIYIDDVVSAYTILLGNGDLEKDSIEKKQNKFLQVDLGSGEPIRIMDFVKMAHDMTNSKSELRFGVLPYREFEIMESKADISLLQSYGWRCNIDLNNGIKNLIKEFE